MTASSHSPTRRPWQVLDQFSLKLLALFTMTLDHTAAVLGRESLGSLYRPLRDAGRLAFPIYCFLLVEGYCHTRDLRRYLGRLLLWSAVSEIPFDLGIYHRFPAQKSNVMLTLALGLLTILALDRGEERIRSRTDADSFWPRVLLCLGVIGGGMAAAGYLHTDYSQGGVLLISLFFLFRGELWALLAAIPPVLLIYYNPQELWGLAALLPISLYSGRQGPRPGGRAGQWFFYLYYPLHLSVLVLIRILILPAPTLWFGLPMG